MVFGVSKEMNEFHKEMFKHLSKYFKKVFEVEKKYSDKLMELYNSGKLLTSNNTEINDEYTWKLVGDEQEEKEVI